jgi:hypothetical protein
VSELTINKKIEITATIELTEGELRALDAMASYGADAFLRSFYVKLGKQYMKPFERDLRGLFDRINSQVRPALRGIQAARKELGLPIHD